jgi:AcrR family transcriptional regulator
MTSAPAARTAASAGRRRRSDAIDNEDRVRRAAHAVFERRGQMATMSDIADEARVSRGTVYRVYESREALFDEMTLHYTDRLARRFEEESENPSAWEGFCNALLNPHLGIVATKDTLSPDAPHGPVRQSQERAWMAMHSLFERCKREGSIRPDVELENLTVLMRGLYLAIPDFSERPPEVVRHYASIILRGMRA